MIKVIGEIGINHNGDVEIAKKLMMVAKVAGCHFVKFQKRTPELCVPEAQKSVMRDTPWGEMTYLEYKERLEFGEAEYNIINEYAYEIGIDWFASVWDTESVDFMANYTGYGKIPSALITDHNLLERARESFDYLMISTGMSFEEEIEQAVAISDPELIFHTNSSYPSPVDELNLRYIEKLVKKYPTREIGYSGHEFGLTPSIVTAALGATWIERHITLDRTMWGSDQMASVEPHGLIKLVRGLSEVERALGSADWSRYPTDSELPKRKSLRGV